MTIDVLKSELGKPALLFLLMILASVCNGMKQLAVVGQTGEPMTCREYWAHVPETLATLGTNVIAFAVLVMTDELNLASALAVGYGANSLSDLLPRGQRSFALKSTPDDPTKVTKP